MCLSAGGSIFLNFKGLSEKTTSFKYGYWFLPRFALSVLSLLVSWGCEVYVFIRFKIVPSNSPVLSVRFFNLQESRDPIEFATNLSRAGRGL